MASTSIKSAKARAKREGWSHLIQTEADEVALTRGCYFDRAAADHVVGFFSECLYYQGEPLRLLDWQYDYLTPLFGWRRRDGRRRFRRSGCWIPKKNGKSLIASGLILYLLVADNEPQAYVFSAATSIKNAKIVFDEARIMARSSPVLCDHLEDIPSTRRIVFPATNSYYEVLSSRAESAEGFSIHGLVLDELHAHKSDDLFNAVRYGGRGRKQPLMVTISTAGLYDPESIAWRQWQYACDVRDGVIKDTEFFAAIYAADAEDDWTDPKTWEKANPALRVQRDGTPGPMDPEDFEKDAEEARTSPHSQNSFKRYSLNLWTQATSTWITDAVWSDGPQDLDLTPEQIKAIDWYGGLDLSNTTDITAFALIGRDDDGFHHLRTWFWVSEEQARTRQEVDNVPYLTWVQEKRVRATRGHGVDYATVRRDLDEIAKTYPIKRVAIDRWNATETVQHLADDGWPVEWFGQGFKSMSAPTKEFDRLAAERKIVHRNDPVLRWMLRNVVIETDDADNWKVSKKKSKEKVDGVVAAVMALAMLTAPKAKASMYEARAAARKAGASGTEAA